MKALVTNLQETAELDKTKFNVLLIKNLIKCSPEEAFVNQQLQYTSLNDIVCDLYLQAKAQYLRNICQHSVFTESGSKAVALNLIEKTVKLYVQTLEKTAQEMKQLEVLRFGQIELFKWMVQRNKEYRELIKTVANH